MSELRPLPPSDSHMEGSFIALAGGVGGAKLALGLDRVLPAGHLTVIVNVGDDFEHLGLHISPDIDTVLYTLGNLSDTERGWGRADESWRCMDSLKLLGAEAWFQLGDRDIAIHIARTAHLHGGGTLAEFTAFAAARFGIASRIVPATNERLATMVRTPDGEIAFQRYFVEQRCTPVVQALRFAGASEARAAPGIAEAFADPHLRAVVICPSNPYLSIDPILAVPDIRVALAAVSVPVICVSPIIGGAAVKGPTAKIMTELGLTPSQAAICAHYKGVIDALVVDSSDAKEAEALGLPVLAVPTLMNDSADKVRVAEAVIALASRVVRART